MSFLRPEAVRAVARWRESLVGLGALAMGASWIWAASGILGWLGWPLAALGLALIWAGWQRARFRRGDGGPGVVQVDERLIGYWGPLTGGAAAIADLQSVSLDRTGHPAHWVLERAGEPALHIPVTAAGAETLFDAFASLPGFDTPRMLRALESGSQPVSVIWRRAAPVAPGLRLT